MASKEEIEQQEYEMEHKAYMEEMRKETLTEDEEVEEKEAVQALGMERFLKMSKHQIDLLWNGTDQLEGRGTGYIQAAIWFSEVHPDLKEEVAKACIIFLDKPSRFLATGSTAKDLKKRDAISVKSKAADDKLASLLPQLEGGYEATMGDEDKREYWGAFRDVNVTAAKRVALMLLRSDKTEFKYVRTWKKKYGGIPGQVDKNSSGWLKVALKENTQRIFESNIKDVVSQEKEWKPYLKWGNGEEGDY